MPVCIQSEFGVGVGALSNTIMHSSPSGRNVLVPVSLLALALLCRSFLNSLALIRGLRASIHSYLMKTIRYVRGAGPFKKLLSDCSALKNLHSPLYTLF